MTSITYSLGNDIDLESVVRLYRESTLGERRPVDNKPVMEAMPPAPAREKLIKSPEYCCSSDWSTSSHRLRGAENAFTQYPSCSTLSGGCWAK